MGQASRIEWTDATWTPVRARRNDTGKVGVHCEKVSPACKNCYAERLNLRNLPNHGTGLEFTVLNRSAVEIFFDENIEFQPLKWKRPRRIFVCSQTDLFGEFVEEEYIARVFAVMALAHRHTFQVLTKRPVRMAILLLSEDFWDQVDCFMACILDGEVDPLERRLDDLRATAPEVSPESPLSNVWLGVTSENQECADQRIPVLLRTPAAKRFVSCEPLLGAVDLTKNLGGTRRLGGQRGCSGTHIGIGTRECPRSPHHHHDDRCRHGLDWVIVGGESGPGARPMHPEWARDLQDQCQAWEVPFFFKQWGEWTPGENVVRQKGTVPTAKWFDDRWIYGAENLALHDCHRDDQVDLYRVGKTAAGRRLDGCEWNEVPTCL